MFKKGEFSTETDRKPFFFALAALCGCLTASLLIFILGKGDALGIFAGVLLSIVALAAAAVLFAMVTDRAYIQDGVLYMSYMFRSTRVTLSEIGKVTYKENVYFVYDRKGSVIGTINGKLTGIDTVLYALDKKGVSFM